MRRLAEVIAGVILTVGLMVSPALAAPPVGQQGVTALPWLPPPPEFKEMQRQGFHAGVKAAIHDYDHHRFPDPARRREYRHPHVDPAFQGDFRQGFRRGYDDAIHHIEKAAKTGTPGS